jgi:hypothetical protein
MSNERIDILFPVGRLVMGSMTSPQDKDAEGNPLKVKSGPNAGQPRVDYFFAVAIPKEAGKQWWDTEWGAKIVACANAAFPNGQTGNAAFAWKVKDGDSAVPNRRGKKPCDQEGYPGNWIVYFSSGFAPKTFDARGSAAVDPATIKLGHYVQVYGSVAGNGSPNQPGVFINHSIVAHAGYGPEIFVGPDPSAVGFGNGAAPAGMSATPVGGMSAPPAGPGGPGMPAPGPTPMMPAAAPVAAPVPAPMPVAPHPAAMMPPAPGGAPAAPAPAPAAPAHVMLPAAQGIAYEAYVAKGWSDAQLVSAGVMQA